MGGRGARMKGVEGEGERGRAERKNLEGQERGKGEKRDKEMGRKADGEERKMLGI